MIAHAKDSVRLDKTGKMTVKRARPLPYGVEPKTKENLINMATQNYYKDVKDVVYISTSISTGCEHCDFSVRAENFAGSINHYIEQHGYKLLHVGQETDYNMEGKQSFSTVAVLGK
jgi:hypothetical protein